MTTGSKVVRGAGLITAARVAGYALSFLRSLVLARMLTKADFGLASLLAVTLSLLDFTSRMSLNRQIVQSELGGTDCFRNTCHAMQALLGVASAILLFGFARPMAVLSGVPEITWAFALLALAPLIHGLAHLDNDIRQRQFQYGPSVLCDLVPQTVITAAAWFVAQSLKDFRVMLVLELSRICVMVAMTHLTARTRYRWGWHGGHLRSMFAFGWPLILSGMLLALSQQADRIVVSRFYSLNTVADYSIAFSLITVPFLVFSQVAASTMLPVLSRSQGDPKRFSRHYRLCMECAALASVGLMVPIVALSDRIAVLLYGAKYAGAGAVLSILGAGAAFRLLRAATATAAMAMGDTRNQLTSNVARCFGLALAVILALAGAGVLTVAGAAVAGEVVALFVSVLRLRRRQAIRVGLAFRAALFVLVSVVSAVAVRWLLPHGSNVFLAGLVTAVTMAALGALGISVFAETSRIAVGSLLGAVSRRREPAAVVS